MYTTLLADRALEDAEVEVMIQQHREEQDKISAEIEAALKKAEGERFQPGSWIPAEPPMHHGYTDDLLYRGFPLFLNQTTQYWHAGSSRKRAV